MELPPLSPGIQDRVIEVVVVLVTVRRGWSGGTEGQDRNAASTLSNTSRTFTSVFTLNLQVQNNLLQPKTVTGCTCVVPRILCFHGANNKAAVTMDAAPRVNHNRRRCSVAERQWWFR